MLLSICVPTWNRNLELGRLVYSVVSQMTEELCDKVELVISDNCSDIDPLPMIEEIAKICPSLRIVYNRNPENYGPRFNGEKVYEMAQGEWIWFFGDDDCIYANAISEIVSKIEAIPDLELVSMAFDSVIVETKQSMRLFHVRANEDRYYKVSNYEEFRRFFIQEADLNGGNQALFCFLSSVVHKKANWEKYSKNYDSIYTAGCVHLQTFREGGGYLSIAKPLVARDCKDDSVRLMDAGFYCSAVRDMYELLYRFFDEELAHAIAQTQIPMTEPLLKNLLTSDVEDLEKVEIIEILQRVGKLRIE